MNLAPLVWLGMLVVHALLRREPASVTGLLPHVSVLAYLVVGVLSVAGARDVFRGVSFVTKLIVMYLAAYSLFRAALRDRRSVRLLFSAVLAALVVSVAACLAARLGAGREAFGFHGDPHKYGTYVAILASLGGAYLLTSSGWRRGTGALLVTGSIASFGTAGAILAVLAGMIFLAIVCPERRTRAWALTAAACGMALGFALDGCMGSPLREDIRLMEADGANVRQRYVEWQAEMNLLEDRAMGGTGAGSINDYRSAYYHRLPKLNTLAAFDQNGWLATAAEMGILGLVTFCWMSGHYGALAWRTVKHVARPGSPAPPSEPCPRLRLLWGLLWLPTYSPPFITMAC